MHNLNFNEHPVITPANIHWTEDGQPIATDFDDPYFSKHNGLEETRYVFIQGNKLPERWRTLTTKQFVIGETGFGSGLNFIATWQLWLQTAPIDAHLTFISTELYPLSKHDLIKASRLWPEQTIFYNALIEQYPSLTAGFHLLRFNCVSLLLLIGDATESLQQLLQTDHPQFLSHNQKIDAWFLDGFAPAKNNSLWTDALFQTIAHLSKPAASLATFTAAGNVRRHLQQAGFSITRQKGYGTKREMITGQLAEASPQALSKKPDTPWHLIEKAHSHCQEVTIIGAGIAGVCTARALAEKGFTVTLIDSNQGPAQSASGNLQAVLYNKLSVDLDAFSQFTLSSYLFSTRYYQQLKQNNPELSIHLCGVLQTTWNEKETLLQQQLQNFCKQYPDIAQALNPEQASAVANIPLQQGGLFFPQAGWLHPANVCQHLLKHPRIMCKWNTNIESVQHDGRHWNLQAADQTTHTSPQLVLACGHLQQQFEQTAHLPLKKIRGQVTHLKPTPLGKQLKIVLSGNGYLAPAHNGVQSSGATYTPKQTDLKLSASEHEQNTKQVGQFSNALLQEWHTEKINIEEGRAQFRTASPDYLPICGPVPDRAAYLERYRKLSQDAHFTLHQAGPCVPDLCVIGGLGSRGMSYAPLCAEIIASYLTQSPFPLPTNVVKALHPARFIIRDIIKNRI